MPATTRRVTLASVARSAGVSIATVSKVLNGRHDVAPHTRIRVQELLNQHDYVAPVLRRTEVPQRPTIELQFQGEFRSYAAEALEGIMNAATDLDVSIVISKPDHGPHWARDLVLAGRSALIAVATVYTAAHLEALDRAGLPLVVLDPLHLPHTGVTSIGATNFAGGQAATRHLLALGHRRIAYLGGPAMAASNQARVHGYRAAMESEKTPIPHRYIRSGEFTYQAGARGAATLLDLAERPTAIFAGNDEIALGVIEAARTLGLRVPTDLSVIGFDDTLPARMASPPLTTVRQPLREMGTVALRTALRMANGETIDSHHVELATQLVVRDSTAPAPEPPRR